MMTRCRLILLVGILVCAPSAAQEADTTPVEDTTDVGFGDTAVPPVGFSRPLRGRALTDSLPVVRPEIDLAELLAAAPGSFTYLFDRPGWPDAWSPFGRSPNDTPLSFNDVPFSHVFTGRPAYHLVPFTLIESPRLEAARYGRPYGVVTRQRPFISAVPVTEGTYWRGGDGLQSIDAVHAQHRRRPWFGREGFLNVMGAYSGRATDVEIPGSDLSRGRRVQVRLRYEQRDWSVELLNLHNRRRIGAHHGVVPPPGNFAAIYRSDLAEVERPEAERRILRNDMAATLHARFLPAGASAVTAYWTAETFRYRDGVDTLTSEAGRTGLQARQPLASSSRHRLSAVVEAWTERVRGRFAPQRRSRVYASVRDTLAAAGWRIRAEAGWAVSDAGGGAAASLEIAGRTGPVGWQADVSTARPVPAIAYETGFGSLAGLEGLESGRITAGRIEAALGGGAIDVAAGLFGHQQASPVDVFADGDSAAVLRGTSPLRRVGAYADLAWRRDARRGFYATVRPTVTTDPGSDASAFHRRAADALPGWFGRARLGARYAVFRGDLDFDLYLEGVAWAGSSSRLLHPETGLMVVPEASTIFVGASNMLNLVAEVRVRDAKLFLVYDNLLSGTAVMAGNFLVPIYPLPAQRFRFGVYWPIFG